eukprot:gb/GECH01004868.1/.p1 GENE.gb/GECH01004868.1/~~gb/GECH01004868.1/.p1  ORF type:complete len:2114 (+),score=480.09 gb/GECH01004868.1/:1-6342(+)
MKDDLFTTHYAKIPMRRSLLGEEFYNRPTESVFNDLMSMLVQGPFDHRRNYRFSSNLEPQTLHTFLYSIPYLETKAQIAVLNAFLSCIQRCTSNRAICCNSNAIEMAIYVLMWDQSHCHLSAKAFEQMMAAISILGSHSVKPRELKGLLRLMRSDNKLLKLTVAEPTLKTIKRMISSSGPASYFSFDSANSGIKIARFTFPTNGYSFSTWIRLEKIRERSHHRLFGFTDENGTGIEVRFLGRSICILVFSRKGINSTHFKYPFNLQQWYFLTITHSKAMFFFSKSQIQLFINGNQVSESTIKYPSLQKETQHIGYIGSTDPIHYYENRLSHMYFQTGPLAFFDSALSANEVKMIFDAGPTFQFIFEKAATDGGWKVDQSISKKLALLLNPRARTSSGYCIDNAPIRNSATSAWGTTLEGTSVVYTSRLHDTLHCIGGVKIFFSLLRMIPPRMGTMEHSICAQILSLIRDIIATDPTAKEDMIDCNGFLLLSQILVQISDTQLDQETLQVIKTLPSVLPQTDQVQRKVLTHLILNFRIWNKTSFQMQMDILNFIKTDIVSEQCNFRHIVGIGHMLDALYLNYSYTTPEKADFDLVINSNLPFEQKVEIRKVIIELIKKIAIQGNSTEEEISSIVGYALDTSHKLEKKELFDLILTLAMDEGTRYSSVILDFDVVQAVVSCLEKDEEEIRLYALKILALFLRAKPDYYTKPETHNLFLAIAHMSEQQNRFSNALYNALMQICMEQITPDLHSTVKILSSNWIACSSCVQVIFQLLPLAKTKLRETVLLDFYSLLQESPENREIILEIPNWSNLFLQVVDDSNDSVQEQAILSLVVKCIVLILSDLLEEKDGYKSINQVMTSIELKKKNHIAHYKYALFSQLFKSIKLILNRIHYKRDQPFWKNAHFLCSQTEGFARLSFFGQKANSSDDIAVHRQSLLEQMIESFRKLFVDSIGDKTAMEILHYDAFSSKRKAGLLRSFIDMAISDKSPFQSLFHIFLRVGLHLLKISESYNLRERVTSHLKTLLCMDSDLSLIPPWKVEYSEDDTQRLIYILGHIFNALEDEDNDFIVDILKGVTRNNLEFLQTAFSDSQVRSVFYVPSDSNWKQDKPYLLAESSTAEFMKQYRDKWRKVLNSEPIISSISNARSEDSILRSSLEKESEKAVDNIEKDLEKQESKQNDLRIHAWTSMFQLKQDLKLHEATRRSRVSSDLRARRIAAEEAQKRLHEHVDENHIWKYGENSNYWALDRRENSLRMRKKLREDPQGTNHSEASVHGVRYQTRQAEKEKERQLEEEQDKEWEKVDSPISPPVTPLEEDDSSLFSLKLKPSNEGGLSSTLSDDESEEELDDINEEEQKNSKKEKNDEEWEDIGDTGTDMLSLDKEERIVLTKECSMVTPLNTIEGRMEISTASIYFITNKSNLAKDKTLASLPSEQKWRLDQIEKIFKRRYLLRSTAMEIFFIDGTTLMFNFEVGVVKQVMFKILSQRLPKLKHSGFASPATQLKKSRITQKWQRREISNFEYLMALNTFANRTYNDFTQYPVFPWVINDYDSEYLDLENPETFRDLSKPIGALNPDRLQYCIERFENFVDPDIPPFHYGSHYSNVGAVVFFLMRLEPFTSYNIEVQGGQFDLPDRLFHSMKEMWENNLHSHSDVKESIPEFYYLPEFLENQRNLDLGRRQDDRIVNDVILPPWAKDAHDFVRLNREALESEYVSNHLHEWIDLIFGYKQRGPEAVKANNVFFYLTYEGAVNIDDIEDPVQKQSVITQIANFGQTPSQLFRSPHPMRNPAIGFTRPEYWPASNFIRKPFFDHYIIKGVPLSLIKSHGDRITGVGHNREVFGYRWPQLRFNQPSKLLGIPFASDITIKQSSKLFAATTSCKLIISGGHFDGSIKCHLLDKMKCSQTLLRHKDVVTCVKLSEDGSTFVSGSKDTTVLVWPLESKYMIAERPKHILYGHEHAIACVDVNQDLDVVVSASQDGTMLIHSALRGNLIRKLNYPGQNPVDALTISPDGHIIVHSLGDLWMFNINGTLLAKQNAYDYLSDMVVTSDSRYLATGGDGKQVVVRQVHDLNQVFVYDKLEHKIRSLTISDDGCAIIAGLDSGKAVHLAFHPSLWSSSKV